MADKRTVKKTGPGRKSAESDSLKPERLIESYRSLVDSSSDSMYIVDRRCRYLFANRHHLERRGMTLEEIIGKTYWGFFMPAHNKEFTKKVKKVMATGKSIQFDHPAQTDPTRHILQTFSPIKDRNGKITTVAIVSKDITTRRKMEEALRESEDRYRDLVEHGNEPICTHDLDGNILSVNEALVKLIGFSRKNIVGKNARDFLAPGVRGEFKTYLAAIKKNGTAKGLMLALNHAGEKRILEYNNTLRTEGIPKPLVRVMVHDITERVSIEHKIKNALSLLRTTLDSTADGILVVNKEGKIETFNRKFTEMWRIPRSVAQSYDGRRLVTFVNKQMEDPGSFLAKIKYLFSHPEAESLDELTFKDGRVFEQYSQPQREGRKIIGRVWSFRDISERKNAEETIRRLAYHDVLTGLPNRLLFNDRLNMALAHAKRNGKQLALMMLDLDEFKEINDNMGHQTGDILLQKVGERLSGIVRESDTVARLGGDEFMLVIPNTTNPEDAVVIAGKIITALRPPFILDSHKIQITTSIGIAIFPNHGSDANTLMRHADIAMYSAKEQGGNNYHIYT
ncbi:MAG: sensor domain-containing diguanylate cyclase [Deltaproteobacteria bacterium]|nr:sensor domain-containing diguanylate cyclase [Deltaproteobacteria bacterium]